MWPGDHRGEFVQRDGVRPGPALFQVGLFHPRGEMCSPKGSSNHGYRQVKTSFHEKKMQVFQEEESPQMVYEACEGGVETSSERKKANPLTF